MSEWVSVKDRMPEQAGKRYLVCAKYGNNKNAVFIACIGSGSGEWETLDCLYMTKVRSPRDKKVYPSYVVTHWMPLPESPNDVNLKRPDCEHAEHDGTGCLGYCGCTQDDEPIESCKRCEKYTGNVSEAVSE